MDGLMTNSIRVIENSLHWQNYVLKASKDQTQRERVKQAIIKLKAELKQSKENKSCN
jgi:hypothetical protein